MGHSILGYGMSLASRAGVSPMMQRRALFNGDDAVLLIFKNGYTLMRLDLPLALAP